MKKFLPIFLLLSSFLTFGLSAQTTKYLPSFLSEGYSTALYKVKIRFYDKELSGLMLFKHRGDSALYNVVLLSEVGLNIVEMKFDGSKSEIVSHKSFFDNRSALKILLNDVGLLVKSVDVPTCKSKKNGKLLKNKRLKYLLDDSDNVKSIYQRLNAFMSLSVSASDTVAPKIISINHKGLKLSIELNKIKYE